MSKRFTLLAILWIAAAFVVSAVASADPDPPEPVATVVPTTEAENTTANTSAPTKDPDTTTKTTASTTTPPDGCALNPCGAGSTCEPRAGQEYVCLCLAGEFYTLEDKACVKAKAFPGQLKVLDITYSEKLQDKRSAEFKTESDKITSALKEGLNEEGMYLGSTVLAFQQAQSSDASTRNAGVTASVEISYTRSSTITQAQMETKMKNLADCEKCPLKGSSFTSSDLCESNPCDIQTTTCNVKDGAFTCNCKDGYIKTVYSERMCLACPSGQKAEGSECVHCSFGYSGLNCGENWKLVLVIVGSVLGALLLITLIILPVVALKSPKKKSKKSKNQDLGVPYVSHSPAKAPLVNGSFVNRPTASINGPATGQAGNMGVPRIPRATSNNNWDSRNNLEMTPSNSRQNLAPGRNSRLNDDQDDAFPYSQSRPQSNPYAQSRPQSNPYGQNRASVNPYAERQGHSNPYYTHDDGRRF